MNLVELAQRIKMRRLDQRLTIEEVAAQAGLTRSWLSKVENFRVTPSLPALAKIANVLELSVAELVAGLDEKPKLVVIRQDERKVVQRDKSPKNKAIYESLDRFYRSYYLRPKPILRILRTMLADRHTLVRRCREGFEFFRALRQRKRESVEVR